MVRKAVELWGSKEEVEKTRKMLADNIQLQLETAQDGTTNGGLDFQPPEEDTIAMMVSQQSTSLDCCKTDVRPFHRMSS